MHTGTNSLTNEFNTMIEARKFVDYIMVKNKHGKKKDIKIHLSTNVARSHRNLKKDTCEMIARFTNHPKDSSSIFGGNFNTNKSSLNNIQLHLNKNGRNILCQKNYKIIACR